MRRTIASLLAIALAAALIACGGGGGGNGGGPGNAARTEYHEFVVVDLDGDGLDDLVAARELIPANGAAQGGVDVFRRNPANPQSLLPKVSYPVARVPWGIAVGDVNGDGLPDVVVSCTYDEAGFRVLLQQAAGGGVLGADAFVAAPNPVYAINTADVDLDGLTDVIVATDKTLALFTQRTAAPGTFNAPMTIGDGSRRSIAADLNADGLVDLVAVLNWGDYDNNFVYYVQDPAVPGTFLPSRTVPAAERSDLTDIAVGELGGNGALDVAAAGARVVQSNIGDTNDKGWWAPQVQSASAPLGFDRGPRYDAIGAVDARIAIADLDGNGRDDIVLALQTNKSKPNAIAVYLQNANATFSKLVRYTIPDDGAVTRPDLYSVALHDMNEDGLLDVVVSTNELFYFPQRADARGQFAAAVRIAGQH